ncbi:MAG: IclR family transcriptional regulator [Pseudomonadota bacterium]
MAAKTPAMPRSLERVLMVLHGIAEAAEGLTLAELSDRLRAPKSTLLTLLRPLVGAGYLVHIGGRYSAGPAMFGFASDLLSAQRFPKLMRPFTEELAERSRETVYVAVLDEEASRITYIDAIESPQPIRYGVPVGTTRPLYCSAAGRLLLAHQEEDWREAYVKTAQLERLTPRTITDRATLRKTLQEVRRTGLSISLEESAVGAGGIAAPILGSTGQVFGALMIGAPIDRFEATQPHLTRLIREMAGRASAALGFVGVHPSGAARR